MPELTPGPDFGGASARGNRQGRAKTLVTVIGALILTPLTVVLGMEVPGSGY